MKFCTISKKYFDQWVLMGIALWPHQTKSETEKEFMDFLNQPNKYITFLCIDDDENPVGFINLSFRSDYVEGATEKPIAYIEGIYVDPEYRKQKIAKRLIKHAEIWAKNCGRNELASSAELQNTISLEFHKNVGFKTANTVVHFIKKI